MLTNELLNFAVSNGMLNLSDLEQQIIMKQRAEYLSRHPYRVYQGSNGKWFTYIPDSTKETKRRLIKRNTRKEVEDVVIDYWMENENPTLNDVFNEWNSRKLELNKIKKATFTRNEQIYKRFYADFGQNKIKDILPEDITDFLEEQISKYDLSSRAFSNLKSLTKGFLKRAKKRKFFNYNVEMIFADMDVSDREFHRTVTADSDQVFTDSEMNEIVDYCRDHMGDICCAGVLLMFVTGMRVGEVVTLKPEDIDTMNCLIFVHRTESRYKENGHYRYDVSEYPKTPAGVRRIIVPESYRWLLNLLKLVTTEFIFTGKSGHRLHTQALRKRLYQICSKLEIQIRSPHKIRKTYGSILLDNNVNRKIVERQMGHTDISCTEKYYHKDRESMDQKRAVINGVFEGIQLAK